MSNFAYVSTIGVCIKSKFSRVVVHVTVKSGFTLYIKSAALNQNLWHYQMSVMSSIGVGTYI